MRRRKRCAIAVKTKPSCLFDLVHLLKALQMRGLFLLFADLNYGPVCVEISLNASFTPGHIDDASNHG